MSVIFKGIASGGKLNILNQIDLEKYCREHENCELLVEIKEFAKSGPKQRMMAYYHKCVLESAVAAWRDVGDPCDKTVADYRLRSELAKTPFQSPSGQWITILESKGDDMTSKRLAQYINDCILFLEDNFGVQVPDSSEYLIQRKVGTKFTTIKTKPKKDNFTQI